MDQVIRYETHLEDQIERKLRQFYARRREPVLRRAETLPAAGGKGGVSLPNRLGGGVAASVYERS